MKEIPGPHTSEREGEMTGGGREREREPKRGERESQREERER